MHRHHLAAALAAVALSAACTSAPEAAPPFSDTPTASPSTTSATSSTSSPSSTASITPASPSRSARGLIIKALGEAAIIETPDGTDVETRITLDQITVDGDCPSGQDASNGHLINLHFRVETTPKLTQRGWAISPLDFAVVGPDGVTDTSVNPAVGYGCYTQKDALPTAPYTPASIYAGWLTLDTRHATGTITFRPPFMRGGTGWEWTIPA